MITHPTIGDIVLYNLRGNDRNFIQVHSYKPNHAEQGFPVAGIVIAVITGKSGPEVNIRLFPNAEMGTDFIVHNVTQGDNPGQWQFKQTPKHHNTTSLDNICTKELLTKIITKEKANVYDALKSSDANQEDIRARERLLNVAAWALDNGYQE